MPDANTLVILDDNQSIVDALLVGIGRLPLAGDLRLVGFTTDSKAHEFVLTQRESVLGFIQDINRQPDGGVQDVTDCSGVAFFNNVIDCLTPWAKTIIFSACCDIEVPQALFSKAGNRLRWISKADTTAFADLLPHLQWLTLPADRQARTPNATSSLAVTLLSPAWDKLCAYLAEHPEQLQKLSPRDFELLAGEFFRSYGWTVDFTSRTRDGGYDVIATRRSDPTDLCVLVQAKRYAPHRPVGVDIIRSLYGLRMLHAASQVVLVTSSYVTTDARKEFRRVIPWELDFIERDRILDWCGGYASVGVDGHFHGR